MKRKLTMLAAFAIVLAILAGGTLAYFTDQETAHNVITSGGVDVELEEEQDPDPDDEYEPGPGEDPTDPDDDDPNPDDPTDPDDDPTDPEDNENSDWPEWPEEGEDDVTPGQEISKVVFVTNHDSDVWVRIKTTVTITRTVYVQEKDPDGNPVVDADGNPVYVQKTDADGEPVVDADGNPVYETEQIDLPLYIDTDKDGTAETPAVTLVELDVGDGDWDWTYKDGYYYYNSAVGKEESTTALFKAVKFSEWAGNEYQHCTINVHVYAEAVQAANNGESALDAAEDSWPGSEDVVGTPFDGEGKPAAAAETPVEPAE